LHAKNLEKERRKRNDKRRGTIPETAPQGIGVLEKSYQDFVIFT
jgi:hypothetical protein